MIYLYTFYELFIVYFFLKKEKWTKSINSLLMEETCDQPINKDRLYQ